MPRNKRNFGISGYNHCIVRGINKGDIFFDEQDRYKFIDVLKEYKQKSQVKIGSYTLMQNHVHLVTKCDYDNLSNFFHSVLISYSSYFNKKYERVGHLFENRFKNKPIETEEYLRSVIKYIHYNPEKAGICLAQNYKWSSYKEFFKKETWIDKDIILPFYGEEQEEALKAFSEQHNFKLEKYYENFVEYELVNKLTDEQVKDMIDIVKEKFINKENSVWNKADRDAFLVEMMNVKGVSINQLSRVMGINRKVLIRLKANK